MKIPVVQGVIERRILVNFRVDPDPLSRVLPAPFRIKLVNGFGMAGVCLIRLAQIRPKYLPAIVGLSSENAAHRIAVEWDQNGKVIEGVYIPRRDSSSKLNAMLGGRLFPGSQHHAKFDVSEKDGHYHVALISDDGCTNLLIDGQVATQLPSQSVFKNLSEASAFFERGSIGYAATAKADEFDGLELRSFNWKVQPLTVEKVKSNFFDDLTRFPQGSVVFDSALLMTGINHEWHACEPVCCEPVAQVS